MPLDPNRIALGWPNYIDEGTLSGGNWLPTLPLSHLQNDKFAVMTKSASLNPADTQFWITFPRRRRLHAVSFPAQNFSATASLRVRVYRDTAGTDLVYDTGRVDAWPVVYDMQDVMWGDDNFWNRRLREDDRKNHTPLSNVFFDERVVGSAVHVEIFDAANLDGAVMLGRTLVMDIWQPEYNVSRGIQHGYDSGTSIKEAGDRARTRYARRVTPKRTATFELAHLSESEAFMRLHRLQRTEDIVGEILYVYSITPSAENYQRNMVCHQTALDPLVNSFHANFENGMSLLEKL
ncbi:hypothetical protein [Vreelandella venusta]|uniref:hypothetical protein n=1 Tax=Vreelandella venusta TaxID=44935 RepID=UPI0018DADC8C|nr:hypothetical protein [Halomonas venusta]QPI65886.1 hypothetical protein IR195_09410 [Halomonas venusta]